jgi:hypothetical protein
MGEAAVSCEGLVICIQIQIISGRVDMGHSADFGNGLLGGGSEREF